MTLGAIRQLLASSSPSDRQEILRELRREFPIHELEAEFNASAEVILEAIARSPDITKRGIRGLIAEACFVREVLPAVSPMAGSMSFQRKFPPCPLTL
jgi:hypothetical protein